MLDSLVDALPVPCVGRLWRYLRGDDPGRHAKGDVVPKKQVRAQHRQDRERQAARRRIAKRAAERDADR